MFHRSGDRSLSSASDWIVSGRWMKGPLSGTMNNLPNGVDGKL